MPKNEISMLKYTIFFLILRIIAGELAGKEEPATRPNEPISWKPAVKTRRPGT
jgi:hypothetical protein